MSSILIAGSLPNGEWNTDNVVLDVSVIVDGI